MTTILISCMFIYEAKTSYDAINDAVGILVIVNIQYMGSKVFVYHFIDDYNFIFNHETFLRFELDPDELKSSIPLTKFWFYFHIILMTTVQFLWNKIILMATSNIGSLSLFEMMWPFEACNYLFVVYQTFCSKYVYVRWFKKL